jgi:hypothetical protein
VMNQMPVQLKIILNQGPERRVARIIPKIEDQMTFARFIANTGYFHA